MSVTGSRVEPMTFALQPTGKVAFDDAASPGSPTQPASSVDASQNTTVWATQASSAEASGGCTSSA